MRFAGEKSEIASLGWSLSGGLGLVWMGYASEVTKEGIFSVHRLTRDGRRGRSFVPMQLACQEGGLTLIP